MAYHTGDSTSFWLRRLVPKRFQAFSGIRTYEFQVVMPYSRTFTAIRSASGEVEEIPESFFVQLRTDDAWLPVLVCRSDSTDLFESLLLTSSLEFQCPHVERFLRLYKAMECLTTSIEIEYRAIRNGLSHPGSALKNKDTVTALKTLFRSVHIDLSKYAHLKTFFHYLSGLIEKHDQLLAQQIRAIAPRMKSSSFRPVFVRDVQQH
jgi:hypothetical protein